MTESRTEIIISSRIPVLGVDFAELWRYRELFWTMAWRSILVRYKQTAVGITWALLRPVLAMVVFTAIFGRIAGFSAGSTLPYPLIVLAGLMPWQFFANSLTESSNSVVANANMIAKVYFPRLILPGAAVISGVIDLLLSGVIYACMMVWYGIAPDFRILLLPFFILLGLSASLGTSLWLAALNVRFRDVRFIVPFLVQLGFFVSPVGFETAKVPEQWRFLYSLNPMVGVIDGFRWCLLGQDVSILWPGVWLSACIVILVLVGGVIFFTRMERSFADII